MMNFPSIQRSMGFKKWTHMALLLSLLTLAGCSSTPEKPAPTALSDFQAKWVIGKAWTAQLGAVSSPLTAHVSAGRLALVSNNGLVSVLNSESGALEWQLALNKPMTAGVGGDGVRYAVITQANELLVMSQGKEIWKSNLPALSLTSPLVAGGRVFVLTSDRTVLAFDGATGQKLWSQQKSGDPLVLKQAGILTTFQENLLVGLSGRLVAMNPANGLSRWDVAIGSSRGTNEVERLVDLVQGVSRFNQVVCARAYQTAVTCVDAVKGSNLWTRSAQGHVGIAGNDSLVFGSESDGKLVAWQRSNGQVAWQKDSFRYRGLTAPAWADDQLVLGDELGWAHWIDPTNGLTLARTLVDASGLAMAPLRVGKNWVFVAKNGLIQALRAE
jgi:outer membrane assembly lipoprotein YfgL